MKLLKKAFYWFIQIQFIIALVLLALLIILNAYEIIQRNLFRKSWFWLPEYSSLMLLWFAMFGTSKMAYEKREITIDMITRKLPEQGKMILRAIIDVLICVLMAVFLSKTWVLFMSQKGAVTQVARYPLQLRSVAMMIAFASLEIIYIADIVNTITSRFKKEN